MIKSIIFLINILVLIKLSHAGCYSSDHSDLNGTKLNFLLIFLSLMYFVLLKIDCRFRNFYNFGPMSGDKKMPSDDDHHEKIELPSKFKFFDKYYSALYASTNGVIKLVNESDKYDNVLDIHNEYYYNSVHFPISNHSLIAPFWTDMSPHRN